jgi:hypothetical protein
VGEIRGSDGHWSWAEFPRNRVDGTMVPLRTTIREDLPPFERLAQTDHHLVKAQFTVSNDADVLEEPRDPERRYCMSLGEIR